MNRHQLARCGVLLAAWLLAPVRLEPAAAADETERRGRLVVGTAFHRGRPQFRLTNQTPFPAAPGAAVVRVLQRGHEVHRRSVPLEEVGPFLTTWWDPAPLASLAPGVVQLCVAVGHADESCARLPLAGSRPDLSVDEAGPLPDAASGLRVVVRNGGDVRSPPFELRVTTRAGDRLVGSRSQGVAPLDPRSSREERVPLDLWTARGQALARCCTSTIDLDPAREVEEVDETNNRLVISHPPPGAGTGADDSTSGPVGTGRGPKPASAITR